MSSALESSSIEKKRSDERLEDQHSHHDIKGGLVVDEEANGWDTAFAKKTMRVVDLRVLPILAAVYALSL